VDPTLWRVKEDDFVAPLAEFAGSDAEIRVTRDENDASGRWIVQSKTEEIHNDRLVRRCGS
jgi:hypothetical protein